MNKKIFFIFILFFIFSLFKLSASQAMQGGEDATGDNLITSVRESKNFYPNKPGCSASLIHPRIAVTASHCHGFARYVSIPGQERKAIKLCQPPYSESESARCRFGPEFAELFFEQTEGKDSVGVSVVQSIAPPGYTYPCSSQEYNCRNLDFGLLVLETPLPFNKAVRMATMDEIKEWIETKTPGVIYGYGLTSSDSGPSSKPHKSTWYPVRTEEKTIMVETRTPGVVTCPGDSGGPLYFRKGSEILYVGPHFTKRHDKAGDSQVSRPCGLFADGTSPWSTHTIMALYPDLMQQALAKVAELEAAEAKIKEEEAQKTKVETSKKPKKKNKKSNR